MCMASLTTIHWLSATINPSCSGKTTTPCFRQRSTILTILVPQLEADLRAEPLDHSRGVPRLAPRLKRRPIDTFAQSLLCPLH